MQDQQSIQFTWDDEPAMQIFKKDGSFEIYRLRVTQIPILIKELGDMVWRHLDVRQRD